MEEATNDMDKETKLRLLDEENRQLFWGGLVMTIVFTILALLFPVTLKISSYINLNAFLPPLVISAIVLFSSLILVAFPNKN